MFKYLAAIVVGALSVAAYAPLEWWWLMLLCIAALYQLLQTATKWQSAKLAFLFSLGQFGVGASWIYVSLQTYGNMPVWMAAISVFFFVVVCSLVMGLVGFIYVRFGENLGRTSVSGIVFFAALWVLAEWSRSILFTGFPWLDVGYSQTTQWLSGYAPLGSVYLVSFVTVFMSAMLSVLFCFVFANVILKFRQPSKNHVVFLSEFVSNKTALLYAMVMTTFITGGAFAQTIQWSQASEKSYQMAIVQANVSVDQKWLPENRTQIVNDYIDQINQYSVDMVILPETALPVALHQTDDRLWDLLRGQNKALLSGVVERDLLTNKIYNSANLVCGNAGASSELEQGYYQGEQIYRKQHLVPFGEYLPLRSVLNWVLNYLQIPMSDFSAGEGGQSLSCEEGLQISLSICYEDAFAAEMRSALVEQSLNGVLVNISEDAWFGNSLAPHQRVQMAQMRAIELARPMLRSANSGPSTYIDFQGNVLASTKQFQQDSMQVNVTPRHGKTPFIRFGMWIIFICFILVISLLATDKFIERKNN